MAKHRFKKVLISGVRLVKALFALLVFVLMGMVRLLAEASNAASAEEEDEPFENLRQGVLNYRTGKIDDGTDPYGWYEDD